MPKGANQHLHSSPAAPPSAFYEVICDARTYYSQEQGVFKVFPKHENIEDGFVQCIKLKERDPNFE